MTSTRIIDVHTGRHFAVKEILAPGGIPAVVRTGAVTQYRQMAQQSSPAAGSGAASSTTEADECRKTCYAGAPASC